MYIYSYVDRRAPIARDGGDENRFLSWSSTKIRQRYTGEYTTDISAKRSQPYLVVELIRRGKHFVVKNANARPRLEGPPATGVQIDFPKRTIAVKYP